MIFKHLSAFKSSVNIISTSNILKRYCSDVRSIKIGDVTFEKTPKTKNPEYVPKKFSELMEISLKFIKFN
jgi:hypothetical protein